MPEDVNSTQFNEMLQVGVNVDLFREGLRQLELEYASFLQRVGGRAAGRDLLQVGAVGNLNTQLQQLVQTIAAVQTNLGRTLQDISRGIVTTLESFEQTIENKFVASSKKRIKQSKEEADARIADINKVNKAERVESNYDRAAGLITSDGRGVDSGTRRGIFVTGPPNIVSDQQVARSGKNAKEIADQVSMMLGNTLDAERQKRVAIGKTFDEHIIGQRRVQAQTGQWLTNYNKAHEEALRMNQRFNQRTVDNQFEALKKRTEAELAHQRRVNAAHDAALAENVRRTKAAERQLEASRAAQLGSFAQFQERLTRNIPQLLAQILRYSIGFSVVFGVINAITGTIRGILAGIVSAFKQGTEYLTAIQNRTADIKEALLENVIYSRQWADNVRIAGEEAAKATQAIQAAASRFALDPEKIEAGLKGLIQGGGLKLLNGDLEKSVEITSKLLSLLRSRGVSETNQRRFVQEVNDLMTGQVKRGNALLQVIGKNVEQWKQLREEAIKAGNFYEVLQKHLHAANERLETADERWTDLVRTLTLYKNELFATLASSLFSELLGTLQSIKKYYEDHKKELHGIAKALGQIVAEWFKFFVELVNSAGGLKSLTADFARFLAVVTSLVDQLDILSRLMRLIFTGDVSQIDKIEKAFERMEARAKRLNKVLTDLDEIESGKKSAKGRAYYHTRPASQFAMGGKDEPTLGPPPSDFIPVPSMLVKPIDFINKPGPSTGDKENQQQKDELRELRASFEEELAKIKAAYVVTYDEIKKQVTEGSINHEEAAYLTSEALFEEGGEVIALANKYKELIKQLKGIKDVRKSTAEKAIDTTVTKAVSGLDSKSVDASIDAIKAQRRETRALQAIERQDALRHKQYMLDVLNEQVAQGIKTRAEAVDKERELIKQTFEDKRKSLEAEREEQGKASSEYRIYTARIKALDNELTDALEANSAKRKRTIQEQAQLRLEQTAQAQMQSLDRGIAELQIEQALTEQLYKRKNLQVEINRLKTQQAELQLQLAEDAFKLAQENKASDEVLTNLANAIGKAATAVKEAKAIEDQSRRDARTGDSGSSVTKSLLGMEWDELRDAISGSGGVVEMIGAFGKALSAGVAMIQNIMSAWSSGKASGGTLGGIGAVMGQVGGMIPGPIGQAIAGVGAVFGLIGGMFKAAARRLAEKMKKEFDGILKQYQSGSISLVEAIRQTEAKRAEAIRKLSGKKGGKDELAKLLPEFDDRIAALIKQQKEIIENFESQLSAMRLHSDELEKFLTSWKNINKQVKEYIDAGGDINKANEFLSLSLEKLRLDAIDALADGEQEAIQDAIKLNDLLKQRIQLVEDFKKAEFDLINADAIERRLPGSVVRGRELSRLRQEHEQKLKDIDAEINLVTKRLEIERTIFDLSTDLAELRRRDEELQLLALERQIQKMKDLRAIVDGITNENGVWRIMESLLKLLGLFVPPKPPGDGGGDGDGGDGLPIDDPRRKDYNPLGDIVSQAFQDLNGAVSTSNSVKIEVNVNGDVGNAKQVGRDIATAISDSLFAGFGSGRVIA